MTYKEQKEIEVLLSNWRRTGRTTRIINAAVDEFFAFGEVYIEDHGGYETSRRSNERLIDIFVNRLVHEHNISYSDVHCKATKDYAHIRLLSR